MGTFFMFLAGITLVYICIGVLIFWWGTRTPAPGSRQVVRKAEQAVATVGQRVGVCLSLSAKGIPGQKKSAQRFNVVLAIDHSASMGCGPGSPLYEAQHATGNFVEQVLRSTCQIGLVLFDHEAQRAVGIGSEGRALREAIKKIAPGGGTSIDEGLKRSAEMIKEVHDPAPDSDHAENIVVLLSDGQSDPSMAREAADNLKEMGVQIITIALGLSDDADLMSEIASSPAHCLKTLNPQELTILYGKVADSLDEVYGYQVRLNETYNGEKLAVSGTGTIYPIHIDLHKTELGWFFPFLSNGVTEVWYQVKPDKMGWYRIAPKPASMELEDIHGNPHTFESNRGPYLLVLPKFGYRFLLPFLNPLFWILFGKIWSKRAYLGPVEIKSPSDYPPTSVPELFHVTRRETFRPTIHPTLVIGLGYTGRWVLTHMKKVLLDSFGEIPFDRLALLHIDTAAPDQLKEVEFAGVSLDKKEFFSLSCNLEEITRNIAARPDSYPHLQWYPAKDYQASLSSFDLGRGTNGDRFLARLALFIGKEKLYEAIRGALSPFYQSGCDVLLVGSMTGGTSSGIFIDVCYLLRRLFEEEKIPSGGVNLFLIPPHSIGNTSDLNSSIFKNAAAFQRELDRWMVHREMPVHIPYNDTEVTETPEASVSHLIDGIFFCGSGGGENPENKLYPMVAEILMMWIQSDPLRNHFHNLTTTEKDLIRELGSAVSTSMGLSSLRLPLKDISELLIDRCMLYLLEDQFLHLEIQDDHFRLVDDSHVQDEAKQALEELYTGSNITRMRPVYLCSMPRLADENTFLEAARKLDQTVEGYRSDFEREQFIQEDMKQVLNLFEEWVDFVLNGRTPKGAAPAEFRAARRGKLSVLRKALDRFIQQCECICRLAQSAPAEKYNKVIKKPSPEDINQIYQSYSRSAALVREKVNRWIWLFVEGPPTDRSYLVRAKPNEPGLYRFLNDHYQRLKRRINEEQQILSPQYLVGQDILDHIYNKYFSPVLDGLIEHFLWEVESNHDRLGISIRFRLHSDEDCSFSPKADAIKRIHKHISELIQYQIKPLEELLAEDFSSPDNLTQYCQVPTNVPKGSADVLACYFLHYLARDDKQLEAIKAVKSRLIHNVKDLGSRDPHWLALISSEALQPMNNTEAMIATRRASGPSWELPYLFLEEQAAAKWERFMNRKGILGQPICARLVSYLKGDVLLIFLVCMAQNLIASKVKEMRECVTLLWDDEIYWLTREVDGNDKEMLLWSAMEQFVINGCDAYDKHRDLPTQKLSEMSHSILKGNNLDLLKERIDKHFLVSSHKGKDLATELKAIVEAYSLALNAQITTERK